MQNGVEDVAVGAKEIVEGRIGEKCGRGSGYNGTNGGKDMVGNRVEKRKKRKETKWG